MNLSFYIAKRYIFSKKSHNAINVISMISVFGIAIATMAMVCTLSVFNGFTDIAVKSFSGIDPDLKIMQAKGKVFDPSVAEVQKVKKLDGIDVFCESLEDNALVRFEDRQAPALIKGVSPEFVKLAHINEIMRAGDFLLKDGDVQFGVLGFGLAINLGVNVGFTSPIEIYAPKRNVKVNLANPSTAFDRQYVYTSGVFMLNQEKYDSQLLFVSLELARELFRYEKEVSSIDIKLKNPNDVSSVKKEIRSILGNQYSVKDRFEQQEESFRMVSVEKWVTYLILIFILVIAVFNIIGSLSMLILDKENDIKILQNLGAGNNLIVRIFMLEGWLISFFGSIFGLLAGLALCLLQQHFGLLKLGTTEGAFIIDAYPVVVEAGDILVIFLTVILIGFMAILYPTNTLRKSLLRK